MKKTFRKPWTGKRRKRKREPRITDYAPHLRGYSQNRFGGHQTQVLRVFRGSKFGAASPCRTLSPEEVKIIEKRLAQRGLVANNNDRAKSKTA